MIRKHHKLATALLWIGFAGLVMYAVFGLTEANDILAGPLIHDEDPQSADVIIILGGGVIVDTKTLPRQVQERVQRGVELYHQDYADNIILTGGEVKDQSYSESDMMLPYAAFFGVTAAALFPEDQATSTYENALFSKEIMEEQDWDTALMVTSAYHTNRACRVYRKQDIDVTCIAAYEHEIWEGHAFRNLSDFRSVIREYAATIYYWLRGYI